VVTSHYCFVQLGIYWAAAAIKATVVMPIDICSSRASSQPVMPQGNDTSFRNELKMYEIQRLGISWLTHHREARALLY